MFRNLLFLSLGSFGAFWLVWPGIITNQGWVCVKDIIVNSEKKPTDAKSFLKDIERKIKLGSVVSTQTLLNAEKLRPIDKLRILGDACFR